MAPPVASYNTFSGVNTNYCKLYVPIGTSEEYAYAEVWKNFLSIEEKYFDTEAIETDEIISLSDKSTSYSNMNKMVCPSISYTRTFNNTNWQALYVPFSMSYNDWKDDFEVARINAFYEYDKDNDGMIDKQVLEILPVLEGNGDLKPNTPYLIKAKTSGEKTITVKDATLYVTEEKSIECSTVETKYTFTGTYSQMKGLESSGYYFMSLGSLKTAPNDDIYLGAFRWYMTVENKEGMLIIPSANIKIRIVGKEDEEEATDIISPTKNGLNHIFTLDGIRINATSVENLKPGLYIINGKKQYVK